MSHHLDLDSLILRRGGHDPGSGEFCLLEAVAFFAGEKHSDHPKCVSQVIGAFGRRFNDDLDDEGRQQLKPFIPRMVGTNTGPADDEKRAWMVTEWLVHVSLPAWLDAAGMTAQAEQLRSLPKIESNADWRTARTVISGLYDAAWKRRREVFDPLRERIREAVKEAVRAKLEELRAVEAVEAVEAAEAVAAVGAAAAAAAVAAVEAAEAAAAAAAAAAAEAVAAAEAAEAAAAVGAAAAVEAVGAVGAAGAARWRIAAAVREAVRPIFKKAIDEHPTIGPLAVSMRQSGFELLEQLIAVGQEVSA